MNLELVPESATVLHEQCLEFDFANPPIDPKELAQALHDKMVSKDGLGLSANQVGLNKRMFVIGGSSNISEKVIINPDLLSVSDKTTLEKNEKSKGHRNISLY